MLKLKKTPFYLKHKDCGGRLVDFFGWALPLEYSGILAEAKAVRTACGLFDASHMGQIQVKGSDALSFLQGLVTNDLASTNPGQLQYNLLLDDAGCVIDDLMVYNFGDGFLCVVNGANSEKVQQWLNAKKSKAVEIIDQTARMFLLCLQGPTAANILDAAFAFDSQIIEYMHFIQIEVSGIKLLISRSGYTGEDGFEIYGYCLDAEKVWDRIITAGQSYQLKLCGLGSRDILRIEAGYPLYGHELSNEINPYQAGLAWAVKLDKEFIGKAVLIKAKSLGINTTRLGLIMAERVVPRQGYEIFYQGKLCGKVVSGCYSPNLEKSIGMAFVDRNLELVDQQVQVKIRERSYVAQIVKLPFVPIRTRRSH